MSEETHTGTQIQLERFRAGDQDALRQILERHHGRVVRIVRSRLGLPLRKRVDVEDVVQDVLIDALEGIHGFEYTGEGSFSHWIAVVTVNRINKTYEREGAQMRNVFRERAMESMQAQFQSGSLRFDLPADESSISSRASREESVNRLETALHSLPENLQEVIRLRDYADCTFVEIKTIMELSNDEAARRLHVKATLALGRALRGTS